MTRDTAPYLLTPVGKGSDKRGARYVLGPQLGPSYQDLVDENECLRDELEWVQRSAERWRKRYEEESALRLKFHGRVDKCAWVLAVISHLYPPLRPVIGRAREDIWGTRA